VNDWTELPSSIRFGEVIDLLLVTGLVFVAVVWLRSSRARLAFGGVLILTALYFLALQLDLTLTSWVLQGFVAVSVVLIIVVFDDDLRRLFERLAVVFLPGQSRQASTEVTTALTRALCRLAAERHGALVVLPGREPLHRHLEGGFELGGRLSEALLLSLFDPHSPGHDGAAVIEGDRLARFAIHLPLSSDHAQLGERGTRHAAALGLSERTDALSLVVSEERGEISVARSGRLRTLARRELVSHEIENFLQGVDPGSGEPRAATWRAALSGRWREALVAVGLTFTLWLIAVPGSGGADVDRSVRVRVYDLPEDYVLQRVDPPKVKVTFHGRRRDLLWLDSSELEARVHATLIEAGRRSFTVGAQQVSHPPDVDVVSVRPELVKIEVRRRGSAETGAR
jgi:uncharacterized protein (TIGR00159 family)